MEVEQSMHWLYSIVLARSSDLQCIVLLLKLILRVKLK